MKGEYRTALRVSNLSRQQVAQVCVDLETRIQEIYVIEEDEDISYLATRRARLRKKLSDGILVHDEFQRMRCATVWLRQIRR
jgi:hypothetical protein